jgi:hypothetical protein
MEYNGFKIYTLFLVMAEIERERKFKEKVTKDDDGGYKIERESKDEFGHKVKEKHEVKID